MSTPEKPGDSVLNYPDGVKADSGNWQKTSTETEEVVSNLVFPEAEDKDKVLSTWNFKGMIE